MVCVVASDAVNDASVGNVVVVMIVVLLLAVFVLGSAVIARPSVAHCFVRERNQKNCKLHAGETCATPNMRLRQNHHRVIAKRIAWALQNPCRNHCEPLPTHSKPIARHRASPKQLLKLLRDNGLRN